MPFALSPEPSSPPRPPRWKTLLAFAIVYFVWGSTFLGIRTGVREMPPLLFAAIRFITAGIILFAYQLARRQPLPTRRQWSSLLVLATLIFLVNYGLLFWAEQRIPSGVAAIMMAIIPLCMALAEILILRTQRMTPRLALASATGMAGVAVLISRSLHLGSSPIDRTGAAALLLAAISWAIASALSRKLPLPPSRIMSAAAQMLAGGLLLTFTSIALGDLTRFHPAQVSHAAWFALAYLIVFGSLIGFTAYVWLIHHESPTRVGTYAYVNPIVAVLLGYLAGGEPLGPRTLFGAAFVLISVVILTTTPAKAAAA